MHKKHCAYFIIVVIVLFITANSANAQTLEQLVVKANDIRAVSDNGLASPEIIFIYHDGSFDLYQPGHPASDALAAFAGGGNDSLLLEAAENAGFPIWRMRLEDDSLSGPKLEIFSIPSPSSPIPDPTRYQPEVDPLATPYVSYISRLYPSDDLFFANEDPKRHRLFDEQGHSLGPIVVDIFGQDLLDAGVRQNDEQNLLLLDIDSGGEPIEQALLRDEQGVVTPHPGFIGAERQGDVPPGRLLSQINSFCQVINDEEACRDYLPEQLDFTQANQPLIRIRITTETREINGAWTGVYYDPARDGEGFSIEFIGENPDQVLIFWYTYQPDGSGEQLWLIGQGEKIEDENRGFVYEVAFQSTQGGRITSTNNPTTVERIPWGTAKLGFPASDPEVPLSYPVPKPGCVELSLFDIEPLDSSIELNLPLSTDTNLPEYELVRLSPKLSGLEQYCDR